MSAQPPLPGFPPVSARPRRRRPAWEGELARAFGILADRAARDRRHAADRIAMLQGQIEDLRHRLADLERAGGIADLRHAPTRAGLRAFARKS